MKKIVVTSDTHGSVETLVNIYRKNKDADMFIHLGDYADDAFKASARLGIIVECIKANGDIGSPLPLRKEFVVDRNKILAVHGHIESVKYSLIRLNFAAQEANANIMLFGHTHVPLIEHNGILFVNPGFGHRGQYAVVTIDNGVANAELKRL